MKQEAKTTLLVRFGRNLRTASTRQITESGNAVPYLIPTDAFEAGWNHGIGKANESIEKAVED